jgi:16S rRNA (cytosine967-C5)-methyltransferase
MTPGARVSAAIAVLDAVFAGESAERALTNWARSARYAGSGDRAAVRDHVFDALRSRRSHGALGGGQDGRAVMLGSLRAQEIDPDTIFTGQGHAPQPLTEAERRAGRLPTGPESRDLPDWLWPHFEAALGPAAPSAAEALRHRAPVSLRVNARRITRARAQADLAAEGIETDPVEHVSYALHVVGGERKIRSSSLYLSGLVELQDTSSQAAMEALDLPPGARVLDYCAGGGGKVLALAARHEGRWFAHDADPRRMADLPARARRAGVEVRLCGTADLAALGPFDAVLCDVPCSGSGTWRRSPQAKWSLTPERLAELTQAQTMILRQAAPLVTQAGVLIYTTCSVLTLENEAIVEAFQTEMPGWHATDTRLWPVGSQGDGFFCAQLKRV